MNTVHLIRTAALALVAASLAATPVEAQFGRLKERVKDAAVNGAVNRALGGGSGEAAAETARSGPVYGKVVLEITPEVLGRVRAVALLESEARQREVAAKRGRETHEACVKTESDRFQREMHAIGQRYQAAAEARQFEKMTAMADTITRMSQAATAGVTSKCGAAPAGSGAEGVTSEKRAEWLSAQKLTDRQFDVAAERIAAFCSAPPASSGDARIPGDGRNIFYVYSAAEVEAIRPNCAELLPLTVDR